MSGIRRFSVSAKAELLERFDRLMRRKGFANRSQAISRLMRDSLMDDEWQESAGEAAGLVTLVYDHETRDVSRRLTGVQHDLEGLIVSTLHIHLDEHNCLEAVVLRGEASAVKEAAESLIATKGVKHGRLVAVGTGRALA